jgi:uncharacterized membrane protein
MILPVTLLALGALFVVVALPLWRRRVPPNRTYGFRTPLTVSNPEVWYATNEVAGRDLVLAGAFIMGMGALWSLFAVGSAPEQVPFFVTAVAVPVLVAVLHTFWWASRYVADQQQKEIPPEKEPQSSASRVPHQRARETERG